VMTAQVYPTGDLRIRAGVRRAGGVAAGMRCSERCHMLREASQEVLRAALGVRVGFTQNVAVPKHGSGA
jgi:hypothetical protein